MRSSVRYTCFAIICFALGHLVTILFPHAPVELITLCVAAGVFAGVCLSILLEDA